MSVFTKPPNDGSGGAGSPKPDAQAAKGPVAPPAKPLPPPAGPPVIVSRTIEIGAGPRSQARPSAPTLHIGPPNGPAAPPARQPSPLPSPHATRTPTLKAGSGVAPKSVRPTAPAMTPGEGVASIADPFERLLSSDVDRGFAALEREPGSSPQIDVSLTDLAEVRSLFAQL